jgi:formylmethanofuran dehydrogenase subunit E
MSEFIRCDGCGDLASFEDTAFINNTPLCSDCIAEQDYILATTNHSYA